MIRRLRDLIGVLGAVLAVACDSVGPSRDNFQTEWEAQGTLSTAPIVVDSLVVYLAGDGVVTARHRHSGHSLWTRRLSGEGASDRLLRSGDVLLVPGIYLYALNVRTGAILWVHEGVDGAAGVVAPVIAGDTVFLGGYTGLEGTALDLLSGLVHWTTNLGKLAFTPTVTPSLVIFPVRSIDELDELVAVNRLTGAVQWRLVLPDSAGFAGGSAFAGEVVGDRLVLGTTIAEAMAVRIGDGAVIWRSSSGNAQQGGGYQSRPLYLNGDVLLQRGDGVLEGWDPVAGAVNWSFDYGGLAFRGPQSCAPHICRANGRVWIISRRGELLWAYGGGSTGVVFLSNVAVAADGWMYAGVAINDREGRVIAFKPPIAVGATP